MHFVQAKSLLTNRNGMNIYRGCTHGLMKLFHTICERHSIIHTPEECFSYIAQMPDKQLSLFDI